MACYRLLRDAGPAVWLPQYEMFALTRYASVRRALEDWGSFPTAVVMNDEMNQLLRGSTLCSDGCRARRTARGTDTPLDSEGSPAARINAQGRGSGGPPQLQDAVGRLQGCLQARVRI